MLNGASKKINQQKQYAASLLTVFLLIFSCTTQALEASKAIKITPLLKSDSSWNDVPITYPEGKAEITGMLVEIAVGAETGQCDEETTQSFVYHSRSRVKPPVRAH